MGEGSSGAWVYDGTHSFVHFLAMIAETRAVRSVRRIGNCIFAVGVGDGSFFVF